MKKEKLSPEQKLEIRNEKKSWTKMIRKLKRKNALIVTNDELK